MAATNASRSAKDRKRKPADEGVAELLRSRKAAAVTTEGTAEAASSSSTTVPVSPEEVGEEVVRDALDRATDRTGERKRQREAKLIKEGAVKRRGICRIDEATTPAQAVLARMLAKVQQKDNTPG